MSCRWCTVVKAAQPVAPLCHWAFSRTSGCGLLKCERTRRGLWRWRSHERAPALRNAVEQYQPSAVAVCTTCVVETIGDDVPLLIREARAKLSSEGHELPPIIACSTPSYALTHLNGWWTAISSIVEQLAGKSDRISGQ